eukprot:6073345-Amphidinium_carterae.1
MKVNGSSPMVVLGSLFPLPVLKFKAADKIDFDEAAIFIVAAEDRGLAELLVKVEMRPEPTLYPSLFQELKRSLSSLLVRVRKLCSEPPMPCHEVDVGRIR